MQIQGNLFGNTNALDWFSRQSASVSGTVRFGQGAPAKPVNIQEPNDSPSAGAIYRGAGRYNWLDGPGLSALQPDGLVFSANLIYSFTSSLTNRINDQSCSVSWSLHLTVVGDKWDITFK